MQDAESLARAFFYAFEKAMPGRYTVGGIQVFNRKWEERTGNSKYLDIAVCVEVLQNKKTSMQDAGSLARAFFDAFEKITTAQVFCKRENIPIRKWEEQPEGEKQPLVAACVEVLQNWKPRRHASL